MKEEPTCRGVREVTSRDVKMIPETEWGLTVRRGGKRAAEGAGYAETWGRGWPI